MSCFVLVHGAFRGGWAWDGVRSRLEGAGHRVEAPDLTVPGPDDPPVTLADWVDQVAGAAERCAGDDHLVLVGHSQGGVVVRAAADHLPRPPVLLAYLDAAVPLVGERAVDLTPGGPLPPDRLPPAATLVPPTPLTGATLLGTADRPESGDADALAAFANERLRPTPLGPSLEVITSPEPDVATTVAFCTGTPPGYPCHTTRDRMDRAGGSYLLIDSGHDAPITHPDAVTSWLLDALRAVRPDG